MTNQEKFDRFADDNILWVGPLLCLLVCALVVYAEIYTVLNWLRPGLGNRFGRFLWDGVVEGIMPFVAGTLDGGDDRG